VTSSWFFLSTNVNEFVILGLTQIFIHKKKNQVTLREEKIKITIFIIFTLPQYHLGEQVKKFAIDWENRMHIAYVKCVQDLRP